MSTLTPRADAAAPMRTMLSMEVRDAPVREGPAEEILAPVGRIPGRRGLTGHDPLPRAARGLGLTLLAVAAAGLAACGGDSGSSSSSSGSSGGGYGSGSDMQTQPRTTAPAAAPTGGGATVALAADESSGLSFDKKTATPSPAR